MELEIINKNNLDLYDFCIWLEDKLFNYLNSSIDDRQLDRFDDYINKNIQINFIDKLPRFLKSRNILLSAFKNLDVRKQGKSYIIGIDPLKFIPNTNAKFIDIIRLINYGNMEINGYPIIDNTFDYFANNLQDLYQQYLKEIQ